MTRINRTTKNLIYAVLLICFFGLFQSCVPHERLLNFQDESDSGLISSQYIQDVQKIVIQTDDILSITVSTFDSTAARVFNKRITQSKDGSFIGQGYLVDEEGNIEFPVLGKIKLDGFTREVAKDTIRNRLFYYLRDPVVDVRFLNLHVSIMGDVVRPGVFTFPDERFTLLEALTLAGDMTSFANRANIMVIREKGQLREFGVVDLTSSRAFESPYFYLKQNDVIYVKPLKEKARVINDPWPRVLSATGVFASLATLVLALTR